MRFLASRDPRPLAQDCPPDIRPEGLFIGSGAQALEVAVFSSTRRPTRPELRQLHTDRTGRRAAPVVVVVLGDGNGRAAMATLAGGELVAEEEADASQVERLCEAALSLPDRHAAIRFLQQTVSQLTAPIPGLRNEGLFALHELVAGVPTRSDWGAAGQRARAAVASRGRELITRLGFTIQDTAGPASILLARQTKVALALFLERPDEIEAPSPRFDNAAPISHALAKADQENLEYVVVAAGPALRVYPVRPTVGVGRRGRTETYVELNLDLLRADQVAYLWLLCSADALSRDGSFVEILGRSADYAADLGTRLRERVYDDVVPQLARALVRARRFREPSPEKLRETYEMALLVLFRLLFVAYAEDKDLLPLHEHPEYRRHSLKKLARRLAEARARGVTFENKVFLWSEVAQLWKAVNEGNSNWGVPAYDGGLFSADHGAGASLERVSLTDEELAPALASLLLDRTEEGAEGPIDFRSLGVREFGTIYEGLLESELSIAETDLAVDQKTLAFVPARARSVVAVREGEIYLHDASGARKSSGAYYTKDFAVEHLLEKALEPALDDHLQRLDEAADAREASGLFFQFHVADIAMGSGHFLVAAIDHIERRLSNYLNSRRLPGVTDELERLRQEALRQLGPDWAGDPIEDTQLLRRQIARRCIFGVDLNPLAVELARLSIWIHTFVPGLPLSFLDATLVRGNSLVGIGTFDEAREILEFEDRAGSLDLFGVSADALLGGAREPVARLGRLAEATAAEVKQARQLHATALEATSRTKDLFTVLTAARISEDVQRAVGDRLVTSRFDVQGDVFNDALVRKAEKALTDLDVLHFPIAFPQVFLGKRGGFDVILGNPPWEKVHVEEHEFWSRHFPGFRGTSQAERERQLPRLKRSRPDLVEAFERERERTDRLREVLLEGPFPGMGSGHPDLYKAFCWRFWSLAAREGGRIGVVLPRAVFAAKGSEEFRLRALLTAKHVDITMLTNSRGWVFDEAEHRYTIALAIVARGAGVGGELALRGPYASIGAFHAGVVREPATFPTTAVAGWNESAAFPLLPSEQSAAVFKKLRRAPRIDNGSERPWAIAALQGDLNSTTGKPLMDFSGRSRTGHWPVFGGEAFDLWQPDTGQYYALADSESVCEHLQERRKSASGRSNSVFRLFPESIIEDDRTLPCRSARIAFRRITRATDTRTVRAALVPPNVFLVDTAPFLLWPRGGSSEDMAFVLGVLSSLPLDWYARRFVETHLDFHVFDALPVPIPANENDRLQVVKVAGVLAAQDKRFKQWAAPLGIKPRAVAGDERDDLVAQLDAAVARLFGLDEHELTHVFETFHEGWVYADRLNATLEHFRVRQGQS